MPGSDKSPNVLNMLSGLKGLGNAKFKIKNGKGEGKIETEFSVTKLPPMKGFKLAESIRVNLAETANRFEVKDDDGKDKKQQELEAATLFFKAVLGLPTEFIEDLQEQLFNYIEFKGGSSGIEKGWATLSGLEDAAFNGLEIISVYEVMGRALYINFSGSFSGILSNFPGMDKILNQL